MKIFFLFGFSKKMSKLTQVNFSFLEKTFPITFSFVSPPFVELYIIYIFLNFNRPSNSVYITLFGIGTDGSGDVLIFD